MRNFPLDHSSLLWLLASPEVGLVGSSSQSSWSESRQRVHPAIRLSEVRHSRTYNLREYPCPCRWVVRLRSYVYQHRIGATHVRSVAACNSSWHCSCSLLRSWSVSTRCIVNHGRWWESGNRDMISTHGSELNIRKRVPLVHNFENSFYLQRVDIHSSCTLHVLQPFHFGHNRLNSLVGTAQLHRTVWSSEHSQMEGLLYIVHNFVTVDDIVKGITLKVAMSLFSNCSCFRWTRSSPANVLLEILSIRLSLRESPCMLGMCTKILAEFE